MRPSDTEILRFFRKFALDPAGCWAWLAGIGSSGYGNFHIAGKSVKAHRVMYELVFGPIPPGSGAHGTCVCHTCDNRKCVRPDHLFLGSQQDNVADRDRKGRARGGSKPGLAHPGCVYGADVRQRIFDLRATGATQQAIADATGVSQIHVSRILRGTRRSVS